MEGTKQLLQVIHEMHSKIIKLERENRALRGELQFDGPRDSKRVEGTRGEATEEEAWNLADPGEEGTMALRRNVSAGSALMLQEQKGPIEIKDAYFQGSILRVTASDGTVSDCSEICNMMTVRRYSISSSMHSLSGNKHHKTDKRNPFKGALEVKGIIKQSAFPTDMQLTNKEEKGFAKIPSDCLSSSTSNKRRSFQDHVYKCRGKVKAVSFLLPVDMSPYSENQGSFTCQQNQNTKQLSPIIEKDM